MEKRFLQSSHGSYTEGNIYANKSALILEWLLREGIQKDFFSLRELVEELGVSIGLVQRTLAILSRKGWLQTKGIRTTKKFSVQKPLLLLESWVNHYKITQKCKMWTYASALNKQELLSTLKKVNLKSGVVLALHSAARAHGCKNTNLDTLELYLLDPSIKASLEKGLQLQPKERGYEVLLIEPYYKALIQESKKMDNGIPVSPALLTFLDLYHFPLRGEEQAEFMIQRNPLMRQIYQKKKD